MQCLTLNVVDVAVVKRRGYTDRLYIQFDAKHPLPYQEERLRSPPTLEIDCQRNGGLRYAEDVLGLTDVRVIDAS